MHYTFMGVWCVFNSLPLYKWLYSLDTPVPPKCVLIVLPFPLPLFRYCWLVLLVYITDIFHLSWSPRDHSWLKESLRVLWLFLTSLFQTRLSRSYRSQEALEALKGVSRPAHAHCNEGCIEDEERWYEPAEICQLSSHTSSSTAHVRRE